MMDAVLNVVRKRLPNGLTVLILELPHVHSVSHALMVRAGPRYERVENNGISHLVEHLVLRGTRQHPDSLQFHVAVESLGGEINGLTQRDASTIHLTVPPRHARAGLRLLAEACVFPTLDGIDVERNVVIEEILDTYDGEGNELDADALSRQLLWPHPLGLPVAGLVEVVEGMTDADCRAHFEKTFVAENAVLCIAGPVDAGEMLAEAASAFLDMPRGATLPEGPPPIPNRGLPIHVQPTDDSQVGILLSFPAPHEHDPTFPALLLLKRILDDGFGSRLRQAICEQRGIAYSMHASVDAYADAGCFDVEVTCAEQKVRAAVEETLVVLAGLHDITEAELDRAKTRHVAELDFALDDPSELTGWYGSSALMGRDVGYEDWLDEVLRVTPADVIALARRMFDPEAALLTLVGPVTEEDVRPLETLLGRPDGSTAWLGQPELGYEEYEEVEEVEEEVEEIVVSIVA